MSKQFPQKIYRILASKWFFYVVLGLFIFQALWIAFSAAYPMAFDEDFHFGIIKIYSHQWSPLLHHPSDADAFGAITRDPSYLYHYLMSFPLRFIRIFTDNQAAQVIFLRLINVALFSVGIIFACRLLSRLRMSRPAIHTVIVLFCLIPVVPLLAAQINYDNLIMPLVALLLLASIRFIQNLEKKKFDIVAFMSVLILCAGGCLVKYAFLPIAVGVVLFIGFYLLRTYARKKTGRSLKAEWKKTWMKTPRYTLVLLFAAIIVAGGLFVERYVVNAVIYKTPLPACERVIGAERCSQYSPWQRNHILMLTKTDQPDTNPLTYTGDWFWGLIFRLFFMVSGPDNGFDTRRPLPIIYYSGMTLAIISGALFIWQARKILRDPFMILILLISALYLVALWQSNYTDFVETGQPVAVNGRYLIPLLLPVTVLAWRAYAETLRRMPSVKVPLVALVFLLFLQGGGVTSFIISSKPAWDWQNQTVVRINNDARKVLKPLIVEGTTQN